MRVSLDAASLLVYRAAWLADQVKEKTTLEASAAKYFATETAQKVVDQSLQMHGGMGLHRNSRIENLYRAVRAPRIYEGASEIQLLVIGRELMKLRGEGKIIILQSNSPLIFIVHKRSDFPYSLNSFWAHSTLDSGVAKTCKGALSTFSSLPHNPFRLAI
jgi:hypothetical protein